MPSSGGHSCPQKDGFLQYMPRSWRLLLLDRRVHACDECLVAGLPRLRIHDGPQEQSKASQAFVGKQVGVVGRTADVRPLEAQRATRGQQSLRDRGLLDRKSVV